MTCTLYYTDQHKISLPPGHKFPIRKYALVRELLLAEPSFNFQPAPLADPDIIALVHDRGYVQGFLDGTLPAPIMRRIGFPWSENLVQRTLASVGGTLRATSDALASNNYGGTLAGGTHHAFRAEGSGFCVFNDIAIAILWARCQADISRAAVVDLDVHQGDGTAAIFENDPHVLTLSLHGRNNFPFRKQRSKIDIELEDKTGDEDYLAALESVLPRVTDFRPHTVFYQSGVDALSCDRLGRLSLTHDGLKRRDQMVMNLCRDLRVPLVITLGGGYGDPIEQTALAHANTYRVAAELLGAPRSRS